MLEERLRNDDAAPTFEANVHAHAQCGAYSFQLLSTEDLQRLEQRNWEAALPPDTRDVAGICFAG
jgi:hypothetical protein